MTPRLTPAQRRIVQLMTAGWSLRTYSHDNGDVSAWLNDGALGGDLAVRTVSYQVLRRHGMLVCYHVELPYRFYRLSPFGKQMAKEGDYDAPAPA